MERQGKIRKGISAFFIVSLSASACAEEIMPTPFMAADNSSSPATEVNPTILSEAQEVIELPIIISSTPVPTQTIVEPTFKVYDNLEVINIPYDPNQTIAVIEHHNPSFGVSGSDYEPAYMTREIYEAQLKYLQENGFYTPREDELLGWLEGRHGLPKKSLIIRIDIGKPLKDYEEGFSLIEQYGFRAILFILAAKIPEQSTNNSLGWDTIRDYVEKGVLIPGSHGTKHPDYEEISEEEARQDALDAKVVIEEKLGREIYFFAYPFDSEAYEEMLLSYYKMLFGSYQNRAFAGNPLVGTRYPYIRGGSFDWEKFEYDLMHGIGGK